MTSPFRFDGTGEPETEEERRKRQLREAMRAVQLGLPLASQLPAMTITAPRSSMLDASARRTADLTATLESALAGPEDFGIRPDVTAAPRAQRRRDTIGEQPESLLSKALNVAAQIPVQPMLAGGRMREAVESTPLGRLTPGTAVGARQTQAAVEERFGPRSGLARAVAIPAAFAGEVVPYVAAGAGIPGLLRSAAITGLTSQRPGGSTVEALGELSGSETLKRLAESPLRTAADVGLDVGINVLPGAVRELTSGFREAARATRGGVGTTRALARQAAQNIAEGARQIGPATRAIGQQLAAEPLTTAALAASVAGEAAVPGAGLLAAALPATTRKAGEAFPDKLFSRLERAITTAPFEKGTPQQWQAAISKGVAAGEREWVGIDDFLKNSQSPTLTKADVLGQFEQGKIRLGETVLDEEAKSAAKQKATQLQDYRKRVVNDRVNQILNETNADRILREESVKLEQERARILEPLERAAKNDRQDALEKIRELDDALGFEHPQIALSTFADAVLQVNDIRAWESINDAGLYTDDYTKRVINRAIESRNAFITTAKQIDEPLVRIGTELAELVSNAERRATNELTRDGTLSTIDAQIREAKNVIGPGYGGYTQPGEKGNYREVVLTLDGQDATDAYRSSHWAMDNPLVHVRMTDRALPSGEKALFVEEIQSDWHQAGRKKGYAKNEKQLSAQLDELRKQIDVATDAGDTVKARQLADEFNTLFETYRNWQLGYSTNIPNAPFKKTQEWAELGLKRVIQEAVDKGYDRVVMVRGQQAADNFDLSRQINELGWATTDNGNTYTLQAIERPSDTQMATREIAKGIPAKDLPDYIGKDVADRIVTAAASAPEGTLRGVDLQVGGEGMKAFYDKIVPNTLRDLGKSMGLKIELEPVKLFTDGDNLSFRITPEVRQKVQTEGMRLYDVTGAVPEALRQTLASPVASTAVGALTGAALDEEDRFRGAFVGAAAGAGVGAGVRGTKALLRNRAALKASGLSPDLADAYTIAKGGIDFTGAEAQKIAKVQRGSWREVFKRGVDSFADAQRELDRLAGRAEARGMAPEASVGTALDIALSSDVTAARAIRSGMGVERGGIIDPITREFIGEPLEDVFKPLGGVAAKNEQALTYAVALRNVGRYDKAVSDLAQWEAMMAAGGPQGQRAVSMAMPSGAQRATRLRDLVGTQGETVPAAGAMAAKPDPMAVYGGNAERLAADRAIVEAFSQKPEFQEFATRMEQYFNNLSEYAVRSGLWTPQQAQAIRESDTFYVPFKRLIEAYTGGGAGPMRGGITPGQVGPGVKRFTGSDLMVGNPAETIASYTAALIRRADMYRVGSTLIDTVDQLGPEAASLLTKIDAGDPMARALGVADAEAAYRQLGLPEEEAKQVADLFVRMDDKNPVITRNTPAGKEYYLVNDPAVYNALMTLNPQDGQAAKAIVAIFGPLKRLGTAFATGYSPQFWFGTNIPRDLVVGLAQNPNITVGDIAVGIKEAAKSVVGRSEMVEQLSRAGMGQVSQYGGPPSPEALARQIAPTSTGQAVAAEATRALGAPLRGLERVGRATELPMRLAAARAAQRTAAEAGVSPRGQMALASRRGATATVDFRRRAGNAFERLLENTVMYYGAAKKGGVWFARAAKNNPKRIGVAAGVITLGTVLEYMMSKGEERKEFVDRPASERARYLHVGPARVALPQEFAALAAGVRIGLAQLEQDDPFVFEQFKQSLFNMLPPIYTDVAKGDIAAAVTPFPVARQAVELSRNQSAFGDRPVVSQAMERRLPEARRYETTAPTYDVLARGARAIGLEEASPIQAEFAARGIFGRFAPAITALTDIAAAPMAGQQAAERVPLPMSRQPLNPVTGFTARPVTRGQSEQEYYSIRSEVEQAKATISALKKVRDEAKKAKDTQAVAENEAQVKRLVAENPVFAAVYNDRKDKQIDKVFSELEDKLDEADAKRQAITAQFRNKKITGQRARQLLDENDQKRAELFRRGYQRLITRVPQ